MSGLRFDPEFEIAAKGFLAAKEPKFTTSYEIREMNNVFLPAIMEGSPPSDGIEQKTFSVDSYDGEAVRVTRFASQAALSSATPLPTIIFLHGGALASGSVEMYAPQIVYLAYKAYFPVFGVDWRLAPEYPVPAGMEDSYAALSWVSKNAGQLNADASKLMAMGDSAGGLISASTVLLARDRQLSPPLAKQILIYPTLDDRIDQAEDPRRDLMLWRDSDSEIAWKTHLDNDKAGTDDAVVPRNPVPQRVANLEGLPSTYIDIGALDFFVGENLKYAQQLIKSGVEVEMHVLPGLLHGWEMAIEIS